MPQHPHPHPHIHTHLSGDEFGMCLGRHHVHVHDADRLLRGGEVALVIGERDGACVRVRGGCGRG